MIAIGTLTELEALHPIGSFALNKTVLTSLILDQWDCVLHFYGECVIGYGETPDQAIHRAIAARERILATKPAPITADLLA